MGKRDKSLNEYIVKSKDFAKPILKHLRELMHFACPDIQETLKWGFPHFEYKGIVCSMASFKQHCAFGFWKASLMKDSKKIFSRNVKTAMGNFGQIKSLKDLPEDKIINSYIKEAVQLNEKGVKIHKKEKIVEQKNLSVPKILQDALNKNKKALNTFDNFNYSNKKDYIEWITSAKNQETTNKRLLTAIEWMAEGKIHNWKYI